MACVIPVKTQQTHNQIWLNVGSTNYMFDGTKGLSQRIVLNRLLHPSHQAQQVGCLSLRHLPTMDVVFKMSMMASHG